MIFVNIFTTQLQNIWTQICIRTAHPVGSTSKWACSYEVHLVISRFAAAANLLCLTGSPEPGQGSQFLRPACPHLGAAVAPLQGLCPQVKSRAAHWFCFVVSVLGVFLYSNAIDWRTSNWNVEF